MEITEQELSAISYILDYLKEEQKHYEESEESEKHCHIYNEVLILKKLLEKNKIHYGAM